MTEITISELGANTDKYVAMAMDQNIAITRDGKVVAKLVGQKEKKELSIEERVAAIEEVRRLLAGVNPNYDLDQIRQERLARKMNPDL